VVAADMAADAEVVAAEAAVADEVMADATTKASEPRSFPGSAGRNA
jgi:hypothetical protein